MQARHVLRCHPRKLHRLLAWLLPRHRRPHEVQAVCQQPVSACQRSNGVLQLRRTVLNLPARQCHHLHCMRHRPAQFEPGHGQEHVQCRLSERFRCSGPCLHRGCRCVCTRIQLRSSLPDRSDCTRVEPCQRSARLVGAAVQQMGGDETFVRTTRSIATIRRPLCLRVRQHKRLL